MIELEEFVDRLCRLGARSGPRRFPRGRRDREILIKSIMLGFDSEADYDETEVNRRLVDWNDDVAPEIELHATIMAYRMEQDRRRRSRIRRSAPAPEEDA